MTTLGAFVAGLVAGAALGVLAGAALGSLDFLAGQVWGKLLVTLVTVAVLWLWRGRDLPQPDRACAHG